MPSRPFISWNINQIGAWFADHGGDLDALQSILVELAHRRTRAAAELRTQVEAAVTRAGRSLDQPEFRPPPTAVSSRYSAFLSYSSMDKAIAGNLKSIIEQSKLETWLDTAGLRPGDEWESVIRRALVQADTVVVAVTANIKGSYVERELAIAKDMRKPIIPVIFDDFLETNDPLALELRKRQYIDFRGRDSEKAAEQLRQAIKTFHLSPVLAMYSIKGGVGKTTLSAHLATYFYKRAGKQVLLIDLDPQSNLSTFLVRQKVTVDKGLTGRIRATRKEDVLAGLRQTDRSIFGVLAEASRPGGFSEEGARFDRFVHRLDSSPENAVLDIVVGDKRISSLVTDSPDEKTLDSIKAGFSRFVEACRRNYDCVVIDMNPSISQLTLLSLGAATDIVSPIKPDLYSVQSIDLLEELAAEQEAAANGLGRILVINDPGQDRDGAVRKMISESLFADRLVATDMASSREFYASPSTLLDSSLAWMPAYGNWGPNPSPARRALKQVATGVAQKVGLRNWQ